VLLHDVRVRGLDDPDVRSHQGMALERTADELRSGWPCPACPFSSIAVGPHDTLQVLTGMNRARLSQK